MANQQNGYTTVPHDTYDALRTYLLNTGVDVDNANQNQCWDSCAILWYQYGLTLLTGNHHAYGCWTVEKDHNASPPFEAIENITQIKRGDIVVFNHTTLMPDGHIGYADEDYYGGHLKILGQNQGQGSAHGTPSDIVNFSTTNIIGAFRNTNWHTTPPTPPAEEERDRFPWFITANKRRSRLY